MLANSSKSTRPSLRQNKFVLDGINLPVIWTHLQSAKTNLRAPFSLGTAVFSIRSSVSSLHSTTNAPLDCVAVFPIRQSFHNAAGRLYVYLSGRFSKLAVGARWSGRCRTVGSVRRFSEHTARAADGKNLPRLAVSLLWVWGSGYDSEHPGCHELS